MFGNNLSGGCGCCGHIQRVLVLVVKGDELVANHVYVAGVIYSHHINRLVVVSAGRCGGGAPVVDAVEEYIGLRL